MLRIALAAAAVMLASAAQAQSTTETRTCRNNFIGGGTTCTTTTQQGSGPGAGTAMNLSRQEVSDQATRIAKWEEACKPKLKYDRYGVPRYSYAHPDCELGLTGQ